MSERRIRRVRDLDFSPSDRSPEAVEARRILVNIEIRDAAADGRYGHAFSEDEMAEARALVRSELPVDPVKALFDQVEAEYEAEHPPANLMTRGISSFIRGVGFQPDFIIFDDVQKRPVDVPKMKLWLNELENRRVTPSLDVADPALEARRLRAERDEQRRRHGSSATCPKHGPTTGGTCRKCRW